MAENLEDFLRRAAERRQQRTQQKPQQKPTPVQPVVTPPPPLNRSPAPSAPSQQRHSQQPPRQQKTQKPKQNKKLEPSLPRSSLAQQVEQRDDQMQAHLHQVFDHQLGQLGSKKAQSSLATQSPKPGETASTEIINVQTEDSLARQVLDAFRNPQSAKLAFVASEIFRRKF